MKSLYYINKTKKNDDIYNIDESCNAIKGRRFDYTPLYLFDKMFKTGPNYISSKKYHITIIDWTSVKCNEIKPNKVIDFVWDKISNSSTDIIQKNINVSNNFSIKFRTIIRNTRINKNMFYDILKKDINAIKYIPYYHEIIINNKLIDEINKELNIRSKKYKKDMKKNNYDPTYVIEPIQPISYNLIQKLTNFFINIIYDVKLNLEYNKPYLFKDTTGSVGNNIIGLYKYENSYDCRKNLFNELKSLLEDNVYNSVNLNSNWQLTTFIKSFRFNKQFMDPIYNSLSPYNNQFELYTRIKNILSDKQLKTRIYLIPYIPINSDKFILAMYLHFDFDILPSIVKNEEYFSPTKTTSNNSTIKYSNMIKSYTEDNFFINFYKQYLKNIGKWNKIVDELTLIGKSIYNQIVKLKCAPHLEKTPRCFAIYAMDIIIDEDFIPKILEINTGPVLQNYVSDHMGNELYGLLFENIYINDDFILIGDDQEIEKIIKFTIKKRIRYLNNHTDLPGEFIDAHITADNNAILNYKKNNRNGYSEAVDEAINEIAPISDTFFYKKYIKYKKKYLQLKLLK